MTFLKTRALPAGERSFSAQAERAKTAARKSSFQSVTGMYDSFYARQKALWFAICPDQKWNSEVYDREKQEVVTQTDSFFLANVEHRVAVNKRRFVCSATAHKTMPCWGCGIRSHFYDRQRQIQEDTGIRPKNEAPLSAMQLYAVAGVLLEQMTKIEAKNPDGITRNTRPSTGERSGNPAWPLSPSVPRRSSALACSSSKPATCSAKPAARRSCAVDNARAFHESNSAFESAPVARRSFARA
jgi:hypothetical protein